MNNKIKVTKINKKLDYYYKNNYNYKSKEIKKENNNIFEDYLNKCSNPIIPKNNKNIDKNLMNTLQLMTYNKGISLNLEKKEKDNKMYNINFITSINNHYNGENSNDYNYKEKLD